MYHSTGPGNGYTNSQNECTIPRMALAMTTLAIKSVLPDKVIAFTAHALRATIANIKVIADKVFQTK